MRLVNVFFIFLMAPFIGLGLIVMNFGGEARALGLPTEDVSLRLDHIEGHIRDMKENVTVIRRSVEEQERQYREQEEIIGELSAKSREHRQLSDDIYEDRILAMLGPPIRDYRSQRVEVKVFKLDELGYRGYIAKVKLFDPLALRVVLGRDKLGQTETTGQAVARTGAVLGINGGGFYSVVQGGSQLTLPMGNTVIDGKIVNGFQPSYSDVFFAGIRRDGKLVGGKYFDVKSLTDQNPWQGVSFVPILIQGGKPLPLPGKWQSDKQPRTIIGEYANGDLIMIVVDGRQSDWSSGVTLERLQNKLAELGVKEGYNLDGGGSSAFIFNGEVLNRPSDGRQRPVATNIVVLP